MIIIIDNVRKKDFVLRKTKKASKFFKTSLCEQMINRILEDPEDCVIPVIAVSGQQINSANPCIIRSSLETLNMLENPVVKVLRREEGKAEWRSSRIQGTSITRAPARSSRNLLRWILLMRAAVRERRSVEGREKMVIRRRVEKRTRVPFERSCLLLAFDVSEEIMPHGMWPVNLSRVSGSTRVWINARSIPIHDVVERNPLDNHMYRHYESMYLYGWERMLPIVASSRWQYFMRVCKRSTSKCINAPTSQLSVTSVLHELRTGLTIRSTW